MTTNVSAAFHRKNKALTLTLPKDFNPERFPLFIEYESIRGRVTIRRVTGAAVTQNVVAHEATGKCELRLSLFTAAIFGAFLAAGVPPIMNSAQRRKTERFLDTRRFGENTLEVYL